jgi:hypothetical protein
MNNKLSNLTIILAQQNLIKEAQSIFDLPNQIEHIKKWQVINEEIESPLPNQIITSIQYMKKNLNAMIQSSDGMKHLSQKDLQTLIEMITFAQQHKANQLNQFQKHGQSELLQNIWKGTKYVGKQTSHLIPVVGFAFSFFWALKGFVYSLTSFSKLLKDSGLIGMSWLEVISPEELKQKATILQNNPGDLLILTRLTKYSEAFSENIISFVTDGADFIKDLIFLFLDIGSFGWMTIGDISISVFFMVIQQLAQSASADQFKVVLNKIKSIVDSNIEKLSLSSNINFDFESMSPDELNKWFEKLN